MAAGGHRDRRIKGRSRYSPCLKKLYWFIIEYGEKINENDRVIQYVTKTVC
jgi:hypothetical protein